jgi:outer membrane scaffolding protein for murein synthesis (MipA/OmpV family)
MQSHLNYYVLDTPAIKLGPGINFVFPVYAGSEIDTLMGMSRSGYIEALAVAQIALPFGQLELTARQPFYSGEQGVDWKASLASGVPAFKIGANLSWVNLQYEFTLFSPETASYTFGVTPSESTPTRTAHKFGHMAAHSLVVGYWIPLTEKYWITTTVKRDWFPETILQSPIVQKTSETTFLIGFLFSFTKNPNGSSE